MGLVRGRLVLCRDVNPIDQFFRFAAALGIFFFENTAASFDDFLGGEIAFIAGDGDFFEAEFFGFGEGEGEDFGAVALFPFRRADGIAD